jgi:hypothetical protein
MTDLWKHVLLRTGASLAVIAAFITGTILLVKALSDAGAITTTQGIWIFAMSMSTAIALVATIWFVWLVRRRRTLA